MALRPGFGECIGIRVLAKNAPPPHSYVLLVVTKQVPTGTLYRVNKNGETFGGVQIVSNNDPISARMPTLNAIIRSKGRPMCAEELLELLKDLKGEEAHRVLEIGAQMIARGLTAARSVEYLASFQNNFWREVQTEYYRK